MHGQRWQNSVSRAARRAVPNDMIVNHKKKPQARYIWGTASPRISMLVPLAL